MSVSDGDMFSFSKNEVSENKTACSQEYKELGKPLDENGSPDTASVPVLSATLKTENSFQFFTISELASVVPTTLPVRNYIRTVGICSGHNLDVLYLAEYERSGEETSTINVNFDSTGTFPTMKSTAEVFGRTDFKKCKTTTVPVLVVWFFRELYGNVMPYIDMCLKLNARRC